MVPERLPGLWLQEQNSAAQEFALQKYKRVGKRHIFLFSLAGVERQMVLCLEFQEYLSYDFCPLLLGSVLTSEVTGIGLTFSPFPMYCTHLRLLLLDAEGWLQVLYFSSMLLQSS